MSKGKRKRRGKKSKRDNGAGPEFWVHLLRETIGNFAGQLMADNTPKCTTPGDAKGATPACDVAADVLRVLGESGPKSIADLLTETDASLTPLLQALRTLREFRLVEMSGDDEGVVQLSASGTRTATALRRGQIEHQGMQQLAS